MRSDPRLDAFPPPPGRADLRRRTLTRAVALAVLASVVAACAGDQPDLAPLGAPDQHPAPDAAPTHPGEVPDLPPLPSRDEEVPPLRPEPMDPTPEPTHEPTAEPDGEPGPAPAPAPSQPTTRSLADRVIALDPGHNGGNFEAPELIGQLVDAGGLMKPCNTTGATSDDGWRESTFNLQLAQALRAELERRGATVRLTRTDDQGVGPCIDDRGRFGGEVGAALLVSLHADGAAASDHGFHVIRPAGWSGQAPQVVERSSALATTVRDALVAAGLTTSNYLGSGGIDPRSDIGTLNLSTVPAVMLEAGNLRNDADLRLLRSSDGQQRIAIALADAIGAHLQ
jgi:N-acetylmuramoyl-L-alanine amidase